MVFFFNTHLSQTGVGTKSFVGAFGVVSLVREQPTGNLYAMKQVTAFLLIYPHNCWIL